MRTEKLNNLTIMNTAANLNCDGLRLLEKNDKILSVTNL